MGSALDPLQLRLTPYTPERALRWIGHPCNGTSKMATKSFSERRVYSYSHEQRVNQAPWSQVASSGEQRFLASDFYGVQNPDWWRQVRYKQNATTLASGTKDEFLVLGRPEAFIAYQAPGQLVERRVLGDPHALLTDPPPGVINELADQVRNAGLTRFLLKCLAVQRSWQSGVFLGEIRQTIRLIRNPLLAIQKATFDYAGACRGLARNLSPQALPKALADQYLSYQFGIKPLFFDIKGAYDAAIRLRDLPQTVKVRSFTSMDRQISCSSTSGTFFDIPYHRETVKYVRCSTVYRGEVKVQSVGPLPPLRQSLGFTARDFIPTVYQLIPYSFVLDYFLNVGEILDALSFCQADLAWYSRSFRTITVSDDKLTPLRPSTLFGFPVVGYSMLPCQVQRSQKTFSRDAGPLGLPSLVLKLPNARQGINLVALAASKALKEQ